MFIIDDDKLLPDGYEDTPGGSTLEYTLIQGTPPWTVTDPQSRLVGSIVEVETGLYEATLTGSWSSYAADQSVSLTWPVKAPDGSVPTGEDEWVVSHRFWDVKPQATTDNVYFGSGVINTSLLTNAAVTGKILGMQSKSSQRRVTLQSFSAGTLTQTESSTNVGQIRGVESHMTRPGRGQLHQSPPAVAMDSWGEIVTTLFQSFTALTLGVGVPLYHCIQLGRNNAGNANQQTIRFRVYTRVDSPYKRRSQGIQMQGAPLNVWVASDSIFSGYPDSEGMPFALQMLELNPALNLKVRPIKYLGSVTPGSSDSWIMDTPRVDSVNGITSATFDTNTVGYLAAIGQIDVMILMLGINDIVAGSSVPTIIGHLQSIINKFNASTNKNANAKVIVFNRIPPLDPTYSAAVISLNASILTLTGVTTFVDSYTGWVPATMSIPGDGHPTYPVPYTITPDYTYGTWYQAKLAYTAIFGQSPNV